MKIAILSANLGNFDTNVNTPVPQFHPEGVKKITFHRFTDADFPPIADLGGRFQYRIPKLFGWEMYPGYDIYIWLDAAMSLLRPDCVKWYVEQLGDADMAFFRHPWRGTVKQEVEHIETKLKEGGKYITSRYKNGLHREHFTKMMEDPTFKDEHLYATTAFIYRNNRPARETLKEWWAQQSRYFTCDQVALPYAIHVARPKINKIPDNLFKTGYLSLVTHHH